MNHYKTPFVIAEIAQAHDGSLGMAHAYIDALAKTGVDAVKFQVHIAEAESSSYESFRVNFSYEDATRYDYWKRMQFSLEQWQALKKHCDDMGVEFLASPFSNAAVDLLKKIGVTKYKIGSGEITNLLLLEKIALTGKPVILSSGMSSWEELDEAISFFKMKKVEVSVLQCTTSYPTKPEQYGFNVIQELKERFKVAVGYSDHSAKIETCIAAIALGAEILEVHAVFNRNSFGPDATSSLTIDEIKLLVKSVRNIKNAINNPVNKNDQAGFLELRTMFGKSLALNKSLSKGHMLIFEDLEAKKPLGYGIPASQYKSVLGKKLKVNKAQWDFLNQDDLNEN